VNSGKPSPPFLSLSLSRVLNARDRVISFSLVPVSLESNFHFMRFTPGTKRLRSIH